METKNSTVRRITHNTKNFESKYGIMYVHLIEFDNNDKGQYTSKSDTCEKFKEGEDANYTIETKVNGQYTNIIIKPIEEEKPSFKAKSGSEESFALSYAKDLACANIQAGRQITAKQVTEVAEEFYNWLKSKK